MGASMTQRPDLFRAVLCEYPDLDMLGYYRFKNNNPPALLEYGDASKPDEFKFLFAYSPYQKVVQGTRYPAVFLRTGDTFHGVLFSTFGAFWVALYYYLQFYSKEVPKAQAGHALALMLIAFGVVAVVLLAASFRTSLVTVLGISLLVATLFVLAAGNYSASATTVKAGGWLGIVLAGVAFYLTLATVGQASYGREILWVGHLAKK